jgi:predicted glycosyltransferase involved in capsule biosynthesis
MLKAQLGDDDPKVSVVQVDNQQYFNKSCAQNLGAFHTTQPFLFFCDCDTIIDLATCASLLEQINSRPGTFGTFAQLRETAVNSRGGKHVTCFGYELRIHTADGRQLRIVDNEEDADAGTRQAPGLLMIRREDFLTINGYNSRLHGWGWEDQDMISRLTLGNGLERISYGSAIHISHDDYARIGHYPPVTNRWESRDRMFRKALANYDDANFQGTYDLDVQQIAAEKISGGNYKAL